MTSPDLQVMRGSAAARMNGLTADQSGPEAGAVAAMVRALVAHLEQ